MPIYQKCVRQLRRLEPRGWYPLTRAISKALPSFRTYRALLDTGDHLWVDLSERMCFGYFAHGGLAHELGSVALLKVLIKDGDCVADVGANIGYFSRQMSKLVGPSGCVIAFEPLPKALRLLELNTSDLSNVRVYKAALSNDVGIRTFYSREAGDTSSFAPGSGEVITVPCTTLDAIVGSREVDFIKIDVEGYELEVLQGARAVIERETPFIYFEHLPSTERERGVTIADFRSVLPGYEIVAWNQLRGGPATGPEGSSCYYLAYPGSNVSGRRSNPISRDRLARCLRLGSSEPVRENV